MPSNLPPGVTDSMIPGNRPEDVWVERKFDELSDSLHQFLTQHTPLTKKEAWDVVSQWLDVDTTFCNLVTDKWLDEYWKEAP